MRIARRPERRVARILLRAARIRVQIRARVGIGGGGGTLSRGSLSVFAKEQGSGACLGTIGEIQGTPYGARRPRWLTY